MKKASPEIKIQAFKLFMDGMRLCDINKEINKSSFFIRDAIIEYSKILIGYVPYKCEKTNTIDYKLLRKLVNNVIEDKKQ